MSGISAFFEAVKILPVAFHLANPVTRRLVQAGETGGAPAVPASENRRDMISRKARLTDDEEKCRGITHAGGNYGH